MHTHAQSHPLDLRKGFPRSPNAMLGPYILLPRIVDKCRALLQGTNGEYNYNCPLDRRFFDFFEVDAEALKLFVATGASDEAILEWVQTHSAEKTRQEINAWIFQCRWAKPQTPEMMAYFEGLRQEVVPDRYDLETWFQLLDAEEGRY